MATPRDPRVESLLDAYRLKWEYEPSFVLATLSDQRAHEVQARFDRLEGGQTIADVVRNYAADMERGDEFPAIVVHRTTIGSARPFTIDGNHRVAGARLNGYSTFPAYVVSDVEIPVLREVLLKINSKLNGENFTQGEKLNGALYLMAANGCSAADAAAAVGVPIKVVYNALRTLKMTDRAERLDVVGRKFLKPSLLSCAHSLTDPAFKATLEFTLDYQLSVSDAKVFIGEVKKTRSEAEQLTFIEMQRSVTPLPTGTRKAASPGRGGVQPPWAQVKLHLGAFLGIQDRHSVRSVLNGVAGDQVQQKVIRQQAASTARFLNDLVAAIDAA